MKKLVKHIWALICYHTGLVSFYARLQDRKYGGRATILLYHRITPNDWDIRISSVPEIKVNVDSFEKQLQYLSKSYNVISLDTLIIKVKNHEPFEPRTLAITFDDGWEDNFKYAWPLLKRHNIPATIFLPTSYIGGDKMFWQERVLSMMDRLSNFPDTLMHLFKKNGHEDLLPFARDFISRCNIDKVRLDILNTLKHKGMVAIFPLIADMSSALKNIACLPSHLRRRKTDTLTSYEVIDSDDTFLTWAHVREMQGPLITFGSHSVNHELMSQLSEEVILSELENSMNDIKGRLGGTVQFFAYPNGDYNDQTVQHLKTSGYVAALTTDEGVVTLTDDLYRLKRINIYENRFKGLDGKFSIEIFASLLSGCSGIFGWLKGKSGAKASIQPSSPANRYHVEKIKWDSKTSLINIENEKPEVDSYDEIFLSMNCLKPILPFFDLRDKSATILDLGCGAGWTTLLLAQKAKCVHAIDISSNSIKTLKLYKNKYSLPNIHLSVVDAECLPYQDNSFDRVFGNAILHHLILDKVLAETSRVLKKDGKAAFCEPFAHNPIMNLYRHIRHNYFEEFLGTDKPITYPDRDIFLKYFSDVRFIECSYLSDKISALRPIESFILEKMPAMRKFASYITILVIK